MEFDETDYSILNALVEDARLSSRSIAQRVGVSPATVMARLKRLEVEKVVRGYSARLDYEKLGYDVDVIIELSISKGKLFALEKKLASEECVQAVYDVTGESDALVVARFKSRRAMDKFLKHIQTYDFVENTNTKLVLNTIKDEALKISLGTK